MNNPPFTSSEMFNKYNEKIFIVDALDKNRSTPSYTGWYFTLRDKTDFAFTAIAHGKPNFTEENYGKKWLAFKTPPKKEPLKWEEIIKLAEMEVSLWISEKGYASQFPYNFSMVRTVQKLKEITYNKEVIEKVETVITKSYIKAISATEELIPITKEEIDSYKIQVYLINREWEEN